MVKENNFTVTDSNEKPDAIEDNVGVIGVEMRVDMEPIVTMYKLSNALLNLVVRDSEDRNVAWDFEFIAC